MESSLVPPPLVSNPPPPPPQPNSQAVDDAERSAASICTMTCSATDLLNVDLLHTIMEHVDSVTTLKTLKQVSTDFAQPARNTLTLSLIHI